MALPTTQEVFELVGEIRKDVSGLKENALTKEESERINKRLDEFEEHTQKQFQEFKRLEGLEAEIEKTKEQIEKAVTENKTYFDRIVELEAQIAQRDPSNKGKNYRDAKEYKAIEAWLRRPDAVPEELKAELRTDVDTAGGFLVPSMLDSEMLKEVVEIDALRSVCRVKTIATKTLDIVVRNDIPRATYEGEGEAGGDDISGYRLVSVTPYRQTVTVPLTLDQIMNAAWDMQSEVLGDAGEGFAEGEGNGFVNGSGHKQPEGFLNNAAIIAGMMTPVDDTDEAAFANALVDMTGTLKVGYGPTWAWHRTTLARLRRLRSAATGEFLWSPNINGPAALTFLGYPYIVLPSMDPVTTASGDLVVLADFRRGYLIVDRVGLSMVRDDLAKKRQAIVEITMHRWNTGIVVMPEAFKLQRST